MLFTINDLGAEEEVAPDHVRIAVQTSVMSDRGSVTVPATTFRSKDPDGRSYVVATLNQQASRRSYGVICADLLMPGGVDLAGRPT
jgi:hypothetical protein